MRRAAFNELPREVKISLRLALVALSLLVVLSTFLCECVVCVYECVSVSMCCYLAEEVFDSVRQYLWLFLHDEIDVSERYILYLWFVFR